MKIQFMPRNGDFLCAGLCGSKRGTTVGRLSWPKITSAQGAGSRFLQDGPLLVINGVMAENKRVTGVV